ncbi:MAG: RsmE family RNA methyltransferase [Candidatus Nanopelagicaceae bacterium]
MLQLFFLENLANLALTGDNAHHAERVLRMSVGEELLVSDGQGNWARCAITSISKKIVELSVIEKGFEALDSQRISVLQAIPKSDRAKETVELLTAAGVAEIYPWQSQRAIGKESDKWAVAALEASKQSRRFHIPTLSTKLDTDNAIKIFKDFEQVLICHESASTKISEVVKPAAKTLIVIGPEGGISDQELAQFEAAGGKIIKLGRPVLRSAHAGIAAVSAVSALMKVW